jgi:hypothetical protein
MDHSLSGTEPAYSARAKVKRVLLRLAVFFLVLITSHWLMLWLHPMGAHAFFWNLALGAGITWLVMSIYGPVFTRKPFNRASANS